MIICIFNWINNYYISYKNNLYVIIIYLCTLLAVRRVYAYSLASCGNRHFVCSLLYSNCLNTSWSNNRTTNNNHPTHSLTLNIIIP